MAIYNTQNGTFSGKVGGLIGSSWKEINYVKGYTKPKQPETEKQVLHKRNFRILINISKFLCKNWLPTVFTESGLLTISNIFIRENKDIFKKSLDEWELKMNGSFSFPNEIRENVKTTKKSLSFTVQSFENLPFPQVKKYLFAIYFVDSGSFFYQICDAGQPTVDLFFGKSFENQSFFCFEQIISVSGSSKVKKTPVSNW